MIEGNTMTDRPGTDAVLAAYTAAVWERDLEALLTLYADDTRIFDVFDHWSYDGRDAWRTAIAAWFASMGEERVRVEFDDVRTLGIAGTDAVVTVSALITYREEGGSADDAAANSMTNRLSWVLRRDGDAWVIAHEHTSVPIDGTTFAGTFQR